MKMANVKWTAPKAVRTVISSESLMTLLPSDHVKCCCSAVIISCQYHTPEQLCDVCVKCQFISRLKTALQLLVGLTLCSVI
jgi:hypothetical protein